MSTAAEEQLKDKLWARVDFSQIFTGILAASLVFAANAINDLNLNAAEVKVSLSYIAQEQKQMKDEAKEASKQSATDRQGIAMQMAVLTTRTDNLEKILNETPSGKIQSRGR